MDMSIKTFRQLQQDFKPHRMMFNELKGKEEAGLITVFLQIKEKR